MSRAERLAQVGTSTRLRIALFGEFGCGNLGNEASFEALAHHLRIRAAQHEVSGIVRCPDGLAERFALPAVAMTGPRKRWGPVPRAAISIVGKATDSVRLIRLVGRYDVVLVPGTGIFEDSMGTRAWGPPWVLTVLGVAARLRRVPLGYVCVGASPPSSRGRRALFACAAWAASYRSFRDAHSRQAVGEIGVRVGADRVYADLAFALDAPTSPRPTGLTPSVGVGVMAYYGDHPGTARGQRIHEEYVAKTIALMRALLDEGYAIRLLVGDPSDQEVARRIADAVGAHVVAEPAEDLHELMGQIAQTDVVVASRYHNVVAAVLLGRPTISIGHTKKSDAVLDDCGLGEYCHHIERFDVGIVVKQLQTLVTDGELHRPRIAAAVATYRDLIEEQFADLDDLIERVARNR